ncbi:sulfite oxidase heme-binding subunit YedZ [Pleionea sp. CnH1-48]|uniref:sulfite oxidase heme-binding subunit YedZ n=1 Tax=Pleionea sp. CnH1-48 TaxID=2954494 RepID=UPI0020976F5C|nr:protein-methionine-sulfoxide reductase heme-binding subunit MsrQ [Pleionea sp. CnH1-48]MCO7223656.1 sulfoxide reductase heme-binding subunit YedZ [Pleionea sp. CnH1-48]
MSFNLNRHHKSIRIAIFIISALPLGWMVHAYYYDNLGINPFEALMNVSGHSTMIFLLLSLAITPVRRWLTFLFRQFKTIKWGKRLSDWNLLIRTRRMLGLYSFFYCTVHAAIYLHLELDWIVEELLWELNARNLIKVGFVSWIILLILSLTSPQWMQKKLKRWWRRIHRLVYPLALLAGFHYLLSGKPTDQLPYVYAAIIILLLGHRIVVKLLPKLRRNDDTGMMAVRKK